MGKERAATAWWSGLFQSGAYKSAQGRTARQVTFAALAIAIALAAYKLHNSANDNGTGASSGMEWVWLFVVPGLVLSVGLWLSYRVVNLPRFADFLIAVEAEMNKVSWPTRAELLRATLVVIVVVFVLAVSLFFFDAVWIKLFTEIGVLQVGE